jgi:hypothetical protein
VKVKSLIATPLINGRADREFMNGMIASQGLYRAWASDQTREARDIR